MVASHRRIPVLGMSTGVDYDTLDSSNSRRRGSSSRRLTNEDTGYSSRSLRPMTTTRGEDRDYRSSRGRDDQSSRYESSSHSSRRDRYGSELGSSADRERSSRHSSRRDDSYSSRDNSNGEYTSRRADRFDMFPSMDLQSQSRRSSSRHQDSTCERTYSPPRTSSYGSKPSRPYGNVLGGFPDVGGYDGGSYRTSRDQYSSSDDIGRRRSSRREID